MTVEEILRQTGLNDEQIKAIDANILTGFNSVLTTATTAQQAAQAAQAEAERAHRAQQELYSTQIAPALDQWAVEKAQKDAEIAFYKTQAEGAKSGGFIPKDAPGYVPPRDPANGQFVPGANAVPGSPAYLTQEDGIKAVSNVTWIMSEHQRLYNQPMPDDFETLMKESQRERLPFRDYVTKKYGFETKRQEIAAARQKEHDDKIRAEAVADNDKKWAERTGNNPMVRTLEQSHFSQIRAAQDTGQRKDPLTMTADERRRNTNQNIMKELNDNAAGTIN